MTDKSIKLLILLLAPIGTSLGSIENENLGKVFLATVCSFLNEGKGKAATSIY